MLRRFDSQPPQPPIVTFTCLLVVKIGTIVHLGDGDDVLGLGQANAGIGLGNPARRREVEGGDAAARIAFGHDQHVADIRLLRHRALDRHGHRHGVAVLGDFRQVQPHPAFGCGLATGEFLDQLLGIVLGGERRPGEPPHAAIAKTPTPIVQQSRRVKGIFRSPAASREHASLYPNALHIHILANI